MKTGREPINSADVTMARPRATSDAVRKAALANRSSGADALKYLFADLMHWTSTAAAHRARTRTPRLRARRNGNGIPISGNDAWPNQCLG
jgi:hypothetical protein